MKKTVMVVDDEKDTVELVKLVLESGGINVIEALNGKECLNKLEQCRPDGILLDLIMPDMDGWEVLKKVKETYPGIPVAMLTAKSQNIDKMVCVHVLKADDYITKPFGKNELIDKVKKLTNWSE